MDVQKLGLAAPRGIRPSSMSSVTPLWALIQSNRLGTDA